MSLTLHTLKPKTGSKKPRKRVGRGLGSTGRYSGRGVKGQRSRSGGKAGLKLLGLRKIMLSMPKNRGFKSHKPDPAVVNVGALNKTFKNGAKITPAILLNKKLVSDISAGVKVLGNQSIDIKIIIEGCQLSDTARAKIAKAGGTIIEKKAKPTKTAQAKARKNKSKK